MNKALTAVVRARAVGRCEYCRFPEALHAGVFHIDHVIAIQHGGRTVADNLALACSRCNSHKGTNLYGLDPVTVRAVRLFHPRKDHWEAHFEWDGPTLRGRTPRGRMTVVLLAINDPNVVAIRELLIEGGLFP